VKEAIVTLDDAGMPVALELEKPKPKLAPAPPPAAPSLTVVPAPAVPAPVVALPAPSRARLVITVPQMPQVDEVRSLIGVLRSRPGDASVTLRTPQGDVPLSEACGLLASQASEVSLILRMDAEITAATLSLVV
jgi:hypothetical protein